VPIGSPGRTLPGGDLWTALFSPPPPEDVVGPFWLLYLLVFAVGFGLSIVAEGDGLVRVLPHPDVRRVLAGYAPMSAALFGSGLFFFGVRTLQIDPLRFAAPIWLVLSLVAVTTYLALVGSRLRREVPAAITAACSWSPFPTGWPPVARRTRRVRRSRPERRERRDAERPAPIGAGRS
jgi:hypothetical protein